MLATMAAACALLAACGGGDDTDAAAPTRLDAPGQAALSAGALGSGTDLSTGADGALATPADVVAPVTPLEAFNDATIEALAAVPLAAPALDGGGDGAPDAEPMRQAMRVVSKPAVGTTGTSGTTQQPQAAESGSTTTTGSLPLLAPSSTTTTTTTDGVQQQTVTIRMADLANVATTVPSLTGLSVFTAQPPYYVQTKDTLKRVKLGIYGTGDDVARGFDFVSPIINPATNRTNALTLQTPIQNANGTMSFLNVSDGSTPKASNLLPGRRIDYANGLLTVGYQSGDPASPDKCRVMVNSWPVPTRTTLTWDLSFKLGTATQPWPLTKPTVSPTLLWQLKADPGHPSMGFFIDTSPANIANLQLTFFQRRQNLWGNDMRWVIPDVKRGEEINMVIQAVLDDRSDPYSSGKLKVWINGKLLFERVGRNLIQDLPDVHRWAFGVYLMAESVPSPTSRVTVWKRARMLVGGAI